MGKHSILTDVHVIFYKGIILSIWDAEYNTEQV